MEETRFEHLLLENYDYNVEQQAFEGLLQSHKNMLIQATRDGESYYVTKLLYYGANVNATDGYSNTPLHYACFFGRREIAEYLFEKGADKDLNTPNHVKSTPLHLACENAQETMVEFLLKKGCDVHAVNLNLWTPLHVAAYKRSRPIIALLLQAGANPQLVNKAGNTVVDVLLQAKYSDEEIKEILQS
eukprot:TRINITY_DN2483_c0_g1_i1.p1 TRINITY_DN2483_c0_g1~~TRINITY_DN2483_c0_g1_i1.p1  ORF type:complete len:188 (-),score=24.51 TRINITY_DN2483_c0_g1_i1:175-738(-)